jgi:DNA polymerase-3 subunit delta'
LSFARIAGQDGAKAVAQAWLRTRRLPHAVLVSGPEGSGKRHLALELAKAANCQERREEACDRCSSCARVEALSHPDVHALLPLPKRRSRREEQEPAVEDLRAAALEYLAEGGPLPRSSVNMAREQVHWLQRELSLAPAVGPWKVGLLFEVERMHPAAANALLKVLEEPPRHALLVLVSSAPEQLLPTVLSRCQRLLCRPLPPAALRARLEAEGMPADRLEPATRLAAGSLERARRVASGQLEERRAQVEGFLRGALQKDDASFWAVSEALTDREGRAHLEEFLQLAGAYLRDLFVMAHGRPELLAQVDRREVLDGLGPLLPPARLEVVAEAVDRAVELLAGNVSAQLVLAELWHLVGGRAADPRGTAA